MWGGKQLFAFIGGGAAGAAQALTSAADIHIWTIPFRCRPIRAGVSLTTTVSSSVSVVVKFDRRPTAGSDSSRGDGDVGALTIPTTAAAGKAYYENTDYVSTGTAGAWVATLDEGEQVVVQVVTPSDSAGNGVPWLLVEIDPEQPGNNTAMVSG
jgi:hypothetical protein